MCSLGWCVRSLAVAAIATLPAAARGQESPWAADPLEASSVVLPYERFLEIWRAFNLKLAAELARLREPPAVVLGSARYLGKLRENALEVTLTLEVALGVAGQPKRVPLVGEGVVLVEARLGEEPLELTQADGYHVWLTRLGGDQRLEIRFLVRAQGPRGSLEYDIPIVETPVTHVACEIPGADLEPRIEGAIDSRLQNEGGVTRLEATLPPSRRIRLVGFRDLAAAGPAEETRVYVEGHHLVSLGDGKLEVFSVLRYTILYAGTKQFHLEIPAGLEVVQADGRGAFRYEVTEAEGGRKLLLGETAFPIRDAFEISLRLERPLGERGERFAVPIPRPLQVEREAGWVAVEVPGRLALAEVQLTDAVAVDLRQLPPELMTAAVSPILKAYRFHRPGRELVLEAARLPEHRVDPSVIERVRATTVLGPEGNLLTELRITLRNRLRRALAMTLAPGVQVQSVVRDGLPVKASQDEEGRLLLPLRRSSAGEEPFTLQVVIEERRDPVGLWGELELALPKLDLPALSIGWTVWVPEGRHYDLPSGLVGERSGSGSWHQGPGATGTADIGFLDGASVEAAAVLGGSMPVRIQVPKDAGIRIDMEGAWLAKDEALRIALPYLSRGVSQALLMGVIALMLLGGVGLASPSRPFRWGGRLCLGASAAGLLWLDRPWFLVAGAGLAVLAYAGRRLVPRAARGIRAWAASLPERYRAREVVPRPPVGLRTAWRGAIFVGMAWCAWLAADRGLALVRDLF
jgi:hypothetical protein